MIRVKICGMAGVEDVATCSDAGADALGFIFAESPRKLSTAQARALIDAAPPFVTTVGVFANDPAELVREALGTCRLDVLQFSGDESPDFCGSFGKPTILSARGRRFTAEQCETARAIAVLLDSWSPTEYGGTGRPVATSKFAGARESSPGMRLILAGGLTPANVGALIRAARPDAVDVRTGVERDGRKDAGLVRAFVAAARGALLT